MSVRQPPRLAKRVLTRSLPVADREAVLGDFEEEFEARVALDGALAARRWYRRQVWRSILPNLHRRLTQPPHQGGGVSAALRAEGIMTDLRYAIRSLRGTPGFTAVALVVLTLGIGATTAIFSVVDAVVLRALPFDEHDRLVAVGERTAPGPLRPDNPDPLRISVIAPQNYLDWVEQQQVFESMAAIAGGAFALQEAGEVPEDLRALRVTAGFFDVLRIRPALGRAFTSEHEIDGAHRVTVLSDALWRRRFASDADIIGRSISLDGEAHEVVGVMPPSVTYPIGVTRPTDLWVPYVVPADERVRSMQGRSSYLQTIARLKPGLSIEQAQAQMDQIASALEQAHPEWNKDKRIGVRPLHEHLVGTSTRQWMLMLLGAVAIVLLIACANVASLMLARAGTRERDVAVRAALGAGRWRLVRQLLVESLVLSAIGTMLATIVTWWGIQVLRSAMPESVPRVTAIALDARVLAAAAGLALVTGVLFGTVPALQGSKPDLAISLKDAARGTSVGRRRRRTRGALVVVEVALAVVLLVGAALFIGSFAKLMRIDPGFNPDRVLTAGLESPKVSRQAFEQILEGFDRIPDIVAAGVIAGGIPMSGNMWSTTITIPGRTIDDGQASVSIRTVSPGYHRALSIPLRRGRLLEPTDRDGAPNVVLINESAAATYFPGQDPLEQIVRSGGGDWTIVGVVGDVHQYGLEDPPRSEVYFPLAQRGAGFVDLVVRTTGDPYAALPAIQSTVLQVLPEVPLRNIRTMDELYAQRIAQRRLSMLLLGFFGVLGLVISAVGIYGVLAAIVSQRTREIGVRMALGATRANVVGIVLARTSLLVVIGLSIGGVGAWYLSGTAEAFLFELEPTNPRAFVVALVTLVAAALAASIVPARRAASVDPVVALRAE